MPNAYGDKMKTLRIARNLSQEELGALMDRSHSTVCKHERGQVRPKLKDVLAAERALDADGELFPLALHLHQRPDGVAVPLGYPPMPRHLVGRAELVDALSSRLSGQSPDATVLGGLGGIGKSALTAAVCAEVKDRYPDGCVVIDFRGYTTNEPELTADRALERLLRQIVAPETMAADRDGRIIQLRTQLAARRMLLVFENVRIPAQVRPMLPSLSNSAVIITSRNRLSSLDGVEHIDVKPLTSHASRELFGLISQVRPDEEDILAEILERCGGLPLAIQAVAARHRTGCWSLADLRAYLDSTLTRFLALDDGENRVATALSVSVDLLRPTERECLTLLSLHPSGQLDRRTVAALTGMPEAAAEMMVSRLVDAYLLDRYPGGAVELHNLVRTLLVDRRIPELSDAIRSSAISRLLEHTAATLAQAIALLEPERHRPDLPTVATEFTDAGGALSWLRSCWPSVVALCELAAESGMAEYCVILANLMRGFFGRDKLIEPWVRTHQCALAAASDTDDPKATATMLTNLGMALLEAGDEDGAARCHQQAVELFTEAGDHYGATDARSSLAWVWVYQDEPALALEQLKVAAGQYEADGRRRNHMITLRGMTLAAARLNLLPEATSYAEQAAEMAETPRDKVLGANGLAWAHFRAGRHGEAEACYFRASSVAELEHEHAERARALIGLGNVAAALGKQHEAEQWWTAAADQPVSLNAAIVPELAHRQIRRMESAEGVNA